MAIVCQILFFLSALLLFHSYVLYPFILLALSKNRQANQDLHSDKDDLPPVSVLISAYNEEQVIEEKIKSLLDQDYPSEKLNILIGSDCSSDKTDSIVKAFAERHSQIIFIPRTERTGKPGVINFLHQYCQEKFFKKDRILILTDANVMFSKNTIFHLVKHFKNPSIQMVDANITNSKVSNEGIAKSEMFYIKREVSLKNREGLIWQKVAGCFGGCYAIRMSAFKEIPKNFIVDDFYITLRVLENKGCIISEPKAICYEELPEDIMEEFRRKKRISAGNFQNMKYFKSLMNPLKSTGFMLWSHKFIRYIGPFLMIIMLFSSTALSFTGNKLMTILLLGQVIWYLLIPGMDLLLQSINLKVNLFRNVRYFNLMNVALLLGYKNYINGIRTNAWEPTKR